METEITQIENNLKRLKKNNFILIESFKYDNEQLVELQQFNRKKLIEHKTHTQLEKEWEEWEKEDDEDNQDTRYFDENGRVFKHEHYVNGCLDCFVVHKFDKKGNHIAMSWYNGAGRLTSRLSYLTRNNRLLEEKCFGGNGRLCWTRRYIYNQNGQIIEQNTYKGKLLFYKIIHDYDENNRKISLQKFIHKDYIQKWNMKTKELGFKLYTR